MPLNFDSSKKETPCFHRTISIQIDSPLTQDDIQAVSRRSDVVLHNKSSPNLTFYLTCLWFLIALKRKLPVSTEQFQFRLTVHYPRCHSSSFKTIWCWITKWKHSKSHIPPLLSVILDSFKNKTPCFHRTISIQIDSPLPQDDTQAVSRQSDVELHNKSFQSSHYTWSVFEFEWL